MSLAIFDLDNTMIDGDSDYLWGEFLCDLGIVDSEKYRQKNKYYLEQYNIGKLNILEYCEFALKVLADFSMAELELMRKKFINEKIKPVYLEKAQKLIDKHKEKGDTLLVITATNRFVAEDIVKIYGIENMLATEPEIKNKRYTGKITGTPTYAQGKVENLILWLQNNKESMLNSSFYSDSYNDIPLLEFVDNPVAVNPDEKLYLHAKKNSWDIVYTK